MNTVTLTGRLVRDPELRSTNSGDQVCQIRLAVDGMGRANSAGFVDVTVWGKPGEVCAKHLTKGWLVGVAGRLDYREWATDDGGKRSAIAVTGQVDFLAAPKTARDETAEAA
jgi:single-strand DNA-binding protein